MPEKETSGYLDQLKPYWEKRFQVEGKVWGDSPSVSARYALKIFQQAGSKTILVPGSGYGRNTRLFSASGFAVTGVEISSAAFQLAMEFDPSTRFFNASALDLSFLTDTFDAVYCFQVLHLLRQGERNLFIRECAGKVKPGGLMFFTAFSEKEPTFGQGNEVEKDTFESKPGRPTHYFTREDIMEHFKGFDLLETGIIEDPENHGGEAHTHILRYICLKNKNTSYIH